MKRALLTLSLVLACAAAAETAHATAQPDAAIVVTFQKHLVDPANLVFEGSTGGQAEGRLTSKLVPGSLTIDGARWTFTFDWIVTANNSRHSFIAETTGVFDTTAGTVVMNGEVIQGWHQGAPVHEEGVLTDPGSFSFAGRIVIQPAQR